jgi:hypothetical protein
LRYDGGMRNRPLHVLSLVSAVVCVLSLGLVGRSFYRADVMVAPIWQASEHVVFALDGKVVLTQVSRTYDRWTCFSVHPSGYRELVESFWRKVAGIRWLGIGWGGTAGWWNILILPLWLVPVVTAVLPVRWWVIRRRARAWRRGFAVEVAVESSAGKEGAGDWE